jgi:HD-like signal output (HDOD) protein/DNA-binding CsgD family transcriptional regulator
VGGRLAGRTQTLSDAFAALDGFPALERLRQAVLEAAGRQPPQLSEVTKAIEQDPALTLATLAAANTKTAAGEGILAVGEAVTALGAEACHALALGRRSFDFFEPSEPRRASADRFRLHAVACQSVADRLARETGYKRRDELCVASLLHDLGKIVLASAYPSYPDKILTGAQSPTERLDRERMSLGIDHALIGALVIRRLQLPVRLAAAIESHHQSSSENREAALIALSDTLVYYAQGQTVDRLLVEKQASACGLSAASLGDVCLELPRLVGGARISEVPSPLSVKEALVLRRLGEGKAYKQIASDLGLAVSTVRTHLHNTYAKLGVSDRAQAVLRASERGWI